MSEIKSNFFDAYVGVIDALGQFRVANIWVAVIIITSLLSIACFSRTAGAAITRIVESEWEDWGEERREDADAEERTEFLEELFETDDPNFGIFFSRPPTITDKDHENWNKHVETMAEVMRTNQDPLLIRDFVADILADTPASNPHIFVQLNDIELRHAMEERAAGKGGESSVRILPLTGAVFRSIAPSHYLPGPSLSSFGIVVIVLLGLLLLFIFVFMLWVIRGRLTLPAKRQP